MHKQISDRKMAANQSNARKSTGPKTVPGKARASLNSFKHGAYAKLETRHREIMLRGKTRAVRRPSLARPAAVMHSN